MRFDRSLPVWGAMVFMAVLFSEALTVAAETVGAVEVVQRNVYGTPPEASEVPKHVGNTVVYRETIKTLSDSAALIRFEDGSKLTVGAQSVVHVDEFVFDPKTDTGNSLLSVSGGAIRFVTGAMPKGNTTIVTPTATMVLRGTEVTIQVSPDGTTTLNVVSGNVDTTAKGSNDKTNVESGRSVRVSPTGFSGTSNGAPGDAPGELDGNTQTGDNAVDTGLQGGSAADKGREIRSNTTRNDDTKGDSFNAQGNQNAGGGHGNNGNL